MVAWHIDVPVVLGQICPRTTADLDAIYTYMKCTIWPLTQHASLYHIIFEYAASVPWHQQLDRQQKQTLGHCWRIPLTSAMISNAFQHHDAGRSIYWQPLTLQLVQGVMQQLLWSRVQRDDRRMIAR